MNKILATLLVLINLSVFAATPTKQGDALMVSSTGVVLNTNSTFTFPNKSLNGASIKDNSIDTNALTANVKALLSSGGVSATNLVSGNSVSLSTNGLGQLVFNVSSNYFFILTNLNSTAIDTSQPWDASHGTNVVTAGLDNNTWASVIKANINSYSNINRFAWTHTAAMLQTNGYNTTFLVFGSGWSSGDAMEGGKPFVSLLEDNLNSTHTITGKAEFAGTFQLFGGSTGTGFNTDPDWPYDAYKMNGTGDSLVSWSGFLSDVHELYYIKTAGGGTFKIQVSPDSSSWVDVPGFTSVSAARSGSVDTGTVCCWTDSVPASITFIRTVDISGVVKVIGQGGWSRAGAASGGIRRIFCYETGGPNCTTIPPSVIGPLMQWWNPDMVWVTANDASQYALTDEIRTNMPNADKVIGGIFPIADPPVTGEAANLGYNALASAYCVSNGWSYFDGHTPFGSLLNMTNRGLLQMNSLPHLSHEGFVRYNEFLWSWLNLLNSPIGGSTPPSTGPIADARLSANVPLLNAANIFSNNNEFQASVQVDQIFIIQSGLNVVNGRLKMGQTGAANSTNQVELDTAAGVGSFNLGTNGVVYANGAGVKNLQAGNITPGGTLPSLNGSSLTYINTDPDALAFILRNNLSPDGSNRVNGFVTTLKTGNVWTNAGFVDTVLLRTNLGATTTLVTSLMNRTGVVAGLSFDAYGAVFNNSSTVVVLTNLPDCRTNTLIVDQKAPLVDKYHNLGTATIAGLWGTYTKGQSIVFGINGNGGTCATLNYTTNGTAMPNGYLTNFAFCFPGPGGDGNGYGSSLLADGFRHVLSFSDSSNNITAWGDTWPEFYNTPIVSFYDNYPSKKPLFLMSNPLTNLYIGANPTVSGLSGYYTGEISAVLVFNAPLNTNQMITVQQALRWLQPGNEEVIIIGDSTAHTGAPIINGTSEVAMGGFPGVLANSAHWSNNKQNFHVYSTDGVDADGWWGGNGYLRAFTNWLVKVYGVGGPITKLTFFSDFGNNDRGVQQDSLATSENAMTNILNSFKAVGAETWTFTTPYMAVNGTLWDTGTGQETIRYQENAWLRGNPSLYDHLIDRDLLFSDNESINADSNVYSTGSLSGLHLGPAGNARLAAAILGQINGVPVYQAVYAPNGAVIFLKNFYNPPWTDIPVSTVSFNNDVMTRTIGTGDSGDPFNFETFINWNYTGIGLVKWYIPSWTTQAVTRLTYHWAGLAGGAGTLTFTNEVRSYYYDSAGYAFDYPWPTFTFTLVPGVNYVYLTNTFSGHTTFPAYKQIRFGNANDTTMLTPTNTAHPICLIGIKAMYFGTPTNMWYVPYNNGINPDTIEPGP